MKEILKALKEHRFSCHKQGVKDTSKIDGAIRVYHKIMDLGRVPKSTVLRIIADLIDINPKCSNTMMSQGELDHLIKILFKEYMR